MIFFLFAQEIRDDEIKLKMEALETTKYFSDIFLLCHNILEVMENEKMEQIRTTLKCLLDETKEKRVQLMIKSKEIEVM